MPHFLGIDAGTTSMKAALFDMTGRTVAVAREEYALLTPEPAIVECDAETYWQACVAAIRQVLAAGAVPPSDIATLAISSQGETLIAVDRGGRALRRAIVWLDNRAAEETAAIKARFGEAALFQLSGQPEAVPTWPACKMLWLRAHEPEVYEAADRFLLLEDYLLFRLTGEYFTETSLQTSSYLLDMTARRWWHPMLDYLGLSDRRLGRLVEPGTLLAGVSAAAAEETGLSTATRVVSGALDQAVAAVGAGNVRPGIVTEITGGALAVVATIDRPYFDPARRLPCYCHAAPGLYCLLPWGQTAGLALKWFRDEFYAAEAADARAQGRDVYDVMTRQAEAVAPGCDGLLMLPHLEGAFTPEYNPRARGVFFGATLRHGRPHFVRGLMESVAYMLKRQLDLVEEMGFAVHQVRSLGGGARSALWLQIKADVLRKPVWTTECEESACLGAAMLGAVAGGWYANLDEAAAAMIRLKATIEPHEAAREVYAEGYARYCELYERLAGFF